MQWRNRHGGKWRGGGGDGSSEEKCKLCICVHGTSKYCSVVCMSMEGCHCETAQVSVVCMAACRVGVSESLHDIP